MSVTAAFATAHVLGEGPCWNPTRSEVVWLDILGERIYHARLDGDRLVDGSATATPGPVGFVAPTADGSLIAGVGLDLVVVTDDGVERLAGTGHTAPGPTRINDGAVDPAGRVFAGVMGFGAESGWGALYRFDERGAFRVIDTMTIPNGLGWSPDGDVMYITDTSRLAIDAHAYNVAAGTIGPAQPFVDCSGAVGGPDGLCVDADGYVWSAIWGAGEVRRFAPDGLLDRTVAVPARQPSSCAFAGSDLDVLVITSATVGLEAPCAGDGLVFTTRPGVCGLPAPMANIENLRCGFS